METRRVVYLALVEKKPDGGPFQVRFPDFPDLASSGDEFDQIFGRAERALEKHVRALIDLGEALPRPIPQEALKNDPDNRNAFLIQIPIEVAGAAD